MASKTEKNMCSFANILLKKNNRVPRRLDFLNCNDSDYVQRNTIICRTNNKREFHSTNVKQLILGCHKYEYWSLARYLDGI